MQRLGPVNVGRLDRIVNKIQEKIRAGQIQWPPVEAPGAQAAAASSQ